MGTVHAIDEVDLAVDPAPLGWEAQNAGDIAGHWAVATARKPSLFDGIVYMVGRAAISGTTLRATCHPARFAMLTYWRHLGMPRAGFQSLFGDVILRGGDGGLLMALTSAHTATGGMLGFPGGSFDDGDLSGGRLDATGCILRECEEETGLGAAEFSLAPGFLVYRDDARIALTRIASLACDAATVRDRILGNLTAQDEPELADIFVVHDRADLDRIDPHPYSRELAEWIFDHDG